MRFFRVVTVAVVVCALGFTTIAGEDEETPLENVAKDSGESRKIIFVINKCIWGDGGGVPRSCP